MEVSREQWLQFSRDNEKVVPGDSAGLDERLPTMDCPMAGITWFEAAHFCNWLSEQDGIPTEQWCYLPNSDGDYGPGMRVKEDLVDRNGYRLPMVSEWICACRGGTETQWPFGRDAVLLEEYAWTPRSSQGHAWKVASLKPNSWGCFDMLGNAIEWCQEAHNFEGKSTGPNGSVVTSEQRRNMRGGAYSSPTQEIRPDHSSNTLVPTRNTSVGFRPAITLSPGH